VVRSTGGAQFIGAGAAPGWRRDTGSETLAGGETLAARHWLVERRWLAARH
ncbi:hypothetical protein PF011_g24834, partial [Phytophthora fragariae]